MGTQSVSSGPHGTEFVAHQIKVAMAHRGVTIKDLSEQTAIPYGTLRDWLLNKSRIPALALAAIARALNVNAHWLLTGESGLDRNTVEQCLFMLRKFKENGVRIDNAESAFLALYDDYYRARIFNVAHVDALVSINRALALVRAAQDDDAGPAPGKPSGPQS